MLCREYERATRGHQRITWSKGLRKLLAVDERTDEEIAAEEVGGDLVVLIDHDAWRTVTESRACPPACSTSPKPAGPLR